MNPLVRPDSAAEGGPKNPDAGAGAGLCAMRDQLLCESFTRKMEKECGILALLTNLLPRGMQRLENVIENDPSTDFHSIMCRVNVNVSEKAQIYANASSYSTCCVGVSVATPRCQEGNALFASVLDLQQRQ